MNHLLNNKVEKLFNSEFGITIDISPDSNNGVFRRYHVGNQPVNKIDPFGLDDLSDLDPAGTLTSTLYGDYCGKGAKRPLNIPSDDCIDEACRQHDICYQNADIKIYPPFPALSGERKKCDRELCRAVYNCHGKDCVRAAIMTVFDCPHIGM